MTKASNLRKITYIVLSAIVLFFVTVFSLKLGSIDVTFKELFEGMLLGNASQNFEVIKSLRLPRVIIGILVGGNLAMSGVLLQSVIRNPLADPSITGISSGACLVSVFFMIFFPTVNKLMPIFGFFGAVFSCFIVYVMAYKKGLYPIRIVLAGAAINAMLGGITSILTSSSGIGAANIQRWISGSLATSSWGQVSILIPYSIIGVILAVLLSKSCNVIALGNKNAKSLGFNSDVQIVLISLTAVFLAGISTAIAGIISFVGLVVPHICRIIIGSDHKYLIPFSGVVGGALLLCADTIGRVLMKPHEVSAGIIMAVIGGPFFLYLLKRSDM